MHQQLINISEAILPAEPRIELLSAEGNMAQYPPAQRWFAELSYRGMSFCGWQRQPSSPSVQQRIEESLQTVLRRPVEVVGAGRTDTGVNARSMWMHFDSYEGEFSPEMLIKSLNQLCGPDIAFRQMRLVRPDAHARFDAVRRTYRYVVLFHKNPFLKDLSWHCFSKLDVDRMNECASILKETSDFTSFAKLHSDARTNICKVVEARWNRLEEDAEIRWPGQGLVFTISADRFLRNMVRAVVGTLVEVGRGKLSVHDFKRIIDARDRCSAGQSVAPQGLYLWNIDYPDDIWL